MKLYLLACDSDTLTGLRLAGIDGALITDDEAMEQTTQALRQRRDIGVLLVARSVSLRYPREVDALKRDAQMLVSEIPDMAHPQFDADAIHRYVKEALGTEV